mmetsp:Transcript_17274/g.42920  ORF Transcript_17274/g.42920 Transcript_17274/m.42920 type:complete len:160 (+) Transcript_17274:1453-1932(+)
MKSGELSGIFNNPRTPTNLKVKILKAFVLPVAIWGCETWSLVGSERASLDTWRNKKLRHCLGVTKLDHIRTKRRDPPENGPEHTEPAGGGKAAAVLRSRSAVSAEPVGAESTRKQRRSGSTGEGGNTNVENAGGARHATEGGDTAGRFRSQKVEGDGEK